jgi:hypothetical protein
VLSGRIHREERKVRKGFLNLLAFFAAFAAFAVKNDIIVTTTLNGETTLSRLRQKLAPPRQ